MDFEPIRTATITCPSCGFDETLTMPEDACQFLYRCSACAAVSRPLAGDCCVFCSYGDVKCPPAQREAAVGKSNE
jgi:hypothetical protein